MEQQKSRLIWIDQAMLSSPEMPVMHEIPNVPSEWLLAHNNVQPEDGRRTSAALKKVHEDLLVSVSKIGCANEETIQLSRCINEARTYKSLVRIHPGANSPPRDAINSSLGAIGATMTFLDPAKDIVELEAVRAVALCIKS